MRIHDGCFTALVALGLIAPGPAAAQRAAPGRLIDSLVARMTLEEKLGQLNLPSVDNQPSPAQLEQLRKGLIGGFLNLAGAQATRDAQRIAVTESPLHIPLLLGLDVIHGYRTIFPIPLAEAATWDPAAAESTARAAAREAAAAGVNWTFAPMVDIARDPRWGRIAEGSGEDPYLGSAMAAARVRGFQGRDLRAPDAVLATVKHFAAYGGAEGGRDYNTVDVSERTLREIYLPPYRAAVEAGAGSIMTSFNEIGGIPSHANRWLVTTLLRDEWKFSGFVVSDWTGVEELRNHGVAGSRADAGKVALEAGVDTHMLSRIYLEDLPALVRAGRIPIATVDAAVRRVLAAKRALGLFDDPYRGSSVERERSVLLAPEQRQLARTVAQEAIVLLKNDGNLLPLGPTRHTLAVIGPLADDHVAALGSWAGRGDPHDAVTPLEGIKARAGAGTEVRYAKGCGILDSTTAGFAAAGGHGQVHVQVHRPAIEPTVSVWSWAELHVVRVQGTQAERSHHHARRDAQGLRHRHEHGGAGRRRGGAAVRPRRGRDRHPTGACARGLPAGVLEARRIAHRGVRADAQRTRAVRSAHEVRRRAREVPGVRGGELGGGVGRRVRGEGGGGGEIASVWSGGRDDVGL